MDVPPEYIGRFWRVTYPDAPEPVRERCCFVLTRGKNKGTPCNKAMYRPGLPVCSNHLAEYSRAEFLYQATCFFATDGSGEMFATVDPIPIAPIFTDTPPIPVTGPPLVRLVDLGAIPMAIERTHECSVCSITENPLVLPCDHTVCVECIKRIASQNCPLCRSLFELGQLKRLA
jgi:hypothetical protein